MLGQPLDFAVQVRLDPGDTLAPECVSAEVTTGDRRLPAGQVRTVVDAQGADVARIRVLTSQGLDEPVIGISLSVGCTSRMTRQFVVLADPPVSAPVNVAVVAPALAAVSGPALAAAPLEAGAGSPEGGELPQGSGATSDRRPAAARAADATPVPRAGPRAAARAEAGASSAKRPRAKAAVRTAERGARRTSAQRAEATAKRRAAVAAAAAPAPRLKLDLLESSTPAGGAAAATAAVEDTVVDQALQAVAQAASAARAAASAASAAAERIALLERTVEQVRGEAKTSSDMVAQLRTRLAQSDSASLWLWPLLALVALLAALAAWLAWRMARLQSAQQQVWRQAAAQAPAVGDLTPSKLPTAPIPFVTSEIHVPPNTLPARPRPGPAWPPPAPADDWTAPAAAPPPRTDPRTEARTMARTEPRRPAAINTVALSKLVPKDDDAPSQGDRRPDTAMQRTEVLPPQARADDNASRDVSIEELIDLEQQAEFFVVLGQDEAAVDLLVDHLRNTGGGSPLPYLKLLEIHHRRGDKAAYERMRTRFNHRFNAYAPEWDLGLHGGRSLEDYPGIVPRLQLVWSKPLDAMAELEALLFRKSRGELFDLPAYREVLFLYSLARDLLDREAADTGNVDLLLPLSEGGEFSPTTPNPYLGLERGRHPDDTLDFDTRPTSPVDFDLTAAERPSSIFDQLDDKPHTRRS